MDSNSNKCLAFSHFLELFIFLLHEHKCKFLHLRYCIQLTIPIIQKNYNRHCYCLFSFPQWPPFCVIIFHGFLYSMTEDGFVVELQEI